MSNNRTDESGQDVLDRTSETRQLGQDSRDRSTGQVGLWVTWTGQPGRDNVWKMYLLQKCLETVIFVSIFTKMLGMRTLSQKF